MKVILLAYTPNGEELVASAAKLCYSKVGVEGIAKKLTDEEIEKFLKGLIAVNHESPLEHISFTFAIEGVSRALSHQLVRHRLASYSQQSQRYVTEDELEYITPNTIAMKGDERVIFNDAIRHAEAAYKDLLARGIPEEDARYLLPNATETKIVVTMNARTLLHFFKLRICRRAQWEIQQLARLMLKEVKQIYRTLFKLAGPSCVYGKCSEGKMSCGDPITVKELSI